MQQNVQFPHFAIRKCSDLSTIAAFGDAKVVLDGLLAPVLLPQNYVEVTCSHLRNA